LIDLLRRQENFAERAHAEALLKSLKE